jgi:hypothetical protein
MGRYADAPVLTQPSCGSGVAGCGPHMRALSVAGGCIRRLDRFREHPGTHFWMLSCYIEGVWVLLQRRASACGWANCALAGFGPAAEVFVVRPAASAVTMSGIFLTINCRHCQCRESRQWPSVPPECSQHCTTQACCVHVRCFVSLYSETCLYCLLMPSLLQVA